MFALIVLGVFFTLAPDSVNARMLQNFNHIDFYAYDDYYDHYYEEEERQRQEEEEERRRQE